MVKEHEKGFPDLYAAIFRQAVEDDIKGVKAYIQKELFNLGFDRLESVEMIDKYAQEIDKMVRENVWKESHNYPNTLKAESVRKNQKIARHVLKNIEPLLITVTEDKEVLLNDNGTSY
jgi:hypothetical protein